MKEVIKNELSHECLIRFSQNRKYRKKTKWKHVNLSEAYWWILQFSKLVIENFIHEINFYEALKVKF